MDQVVMQSCGHAWVSTKSPALVALTVAVKAPVCIPMSAHAQTSRTSQVTKLVGLRLRSGRLVRGLHFITNRQA